MAVGGEGGSQSKAIMAIVLVARQEGILDEVPAKPPKGRQKQTLTWAVPAEVDYGWLMTQLPPVVVVQGNAAAVPVYSPPIHVARAPGFGDHTLTVTVAGNDQYEDATLSMPLHVKKCVLAVRAPKLYMELGGPLPDLRPVMTGAVPACDRLVVTHTCAARADSPENLDGFPITVTLDWQQGGPANYELTVANGFLKVRPGWDAMEKRIKELRARALKLPKERLKALDPAFDEVRDARLKGDQPDLGLEAEKLRQLATDLDEQEYFKVTDVAIAAHAPRIEALETIKLAATVQPPNASQPALKWSVDREDRATVGEDDGVLTRTGKDGGKVIVTATSLCRDGIIKSTVVTVVPRPLEVEVIGPLNAFLDEPIQLQARVLPAEADQRVTWKRAQPTWKKNAGMNAQGQMTVSSPTASGGAMSGVCHVRAVSVADEEVSGEGSVHFGGKKTNSVAVAPSKKVVELGERVTLKAKVGPDLAGQEVDWILDDDSIAHLENVEDLSAEVVMDKGGRVTVRAVARDGTGMEASAEVSVKVHLTAFDVTVPKNQIDIVATLPLTPVFAPKEGACRLDWSFAKDSAPARVDKGVLYPLGKGLIKLTASVPDTPFKKALAITVVAADTMVVDATSWPQIKPLVERYAGRIKITENDNCQQKFMRWLYDLNDEIMNKAKTRTLKKIKDDMIALRNVQYRLSHWDWLEEAGFAQGSESCMIRNDTLLGGRSVHITMFPTAETIEVGSVYQTLENKIYRINAGGHVSVHATLHVNPARRSDQCKVFASGVDWTPPFPVIQFLGGYPAYNTIRSDQSDWLDDNLDDAQDALEALFDGVHENDAEDIA
jgi:hypothetical protein